MHLLSMVCGYNLTFHKSQSRGELRHSRPKSRLGRPWLRHGPVSCLPSPFSFYSVPLSFPDRTGPSSNGRTSDFGSENGGSNPPGPIGLSNSVGRFVGQVPSVSRQMDHDSSPDSVPRDIGTAAPSPASVGSARSDGISGSVIGDAPKGKPAPPCGIPARPAYWERTREVAPRT